MKNLAIIILLSTVFMACTNKENAVDISGYYRTPIPHALVKIELVQYDQLEVIDSFYVDTTGYFNRQLIIPHQGFYRLNFYNKDIVNMVLDGEDQAIVLQQDTSHTPVAYQIVGSRHTDYLYQLHRLQQGFENRVILLNQEMMTARTNDDLQMIADIRTKYFTIKNKHDQQVKATIWQMDNSIAGILSTSFLAEDHEFLFLDSLASKYKSQLPHSPYTQQLMAKVADMSRLAIGSLAPAISLASPDGDLIALSSLRGKYVLIDFWAAWCRPCRLENPNVVRLYQTYAQQGFEVYGVSLDRDKDTWIQAIDDDSLTWTHVSDLQHFQSAVAELYQIKGIPATYLLDTRGIIIAKNLRGAALEAKLQELFE